MTASEEPAALPQAALQLTLYGRRWCHLCEEMEAELEPWLRGTGIGLEVVDIDADSALEARFDEWVPVLMLGDVEICHYRLDIAALRSALGGALPAPPG